MDNVFTVKDVEVIKQKKSILKIDDLTINDSDKIGIIGANGAGKTTLEKLLLNRIQYKGSVTRNLTNRTIGVHLQHNQLNNFYNVKELIEVILNQKINKVKNNFYYRELNVEPMLNKRIKTLSGGEKQKLILFLVFYKAPDVLFFDEPTTGLDYQTRTEIIQAINKLSTKKTLILISHYFNEIELLADKVLILDKGQVVYFGLITDLISSFSDQTLYELSTHNQSEYLDKGQLVEVGITKYLLTSATLPLPVVPINLEVAYKLMLAEERI